MASNNAIFIQHPLAYIGNGRATRVDTYPSSQLAAFRAAGADLPILSPRIGVEGAREIIEAFRQ